MTGPTDAAALRARLSALRDDIDRAAIAVGRDPAGVRLLLATKTVPADRIAVAVDAGFTLLGENRVQEVLAKAADLRAHRHELHFIGHLQSNKINSVLPHLDCLQTVDSADLARRLDARLSRLDRTLDVMVQVNVSGEDTKSGVRPGDTAELVRTVTGLPRLNLVGYMTIGLNSTDADAVRSGYAALRRLRDELLPTAPGAVELSMGMSADYRLAIAEGATVVRIGSGAFGARRP